MLHRATWDGIYSWGSNIKIGGKINAMKINELRLYFNFPFNGGKLYTEVTLQKKKKIRTRDEK